MYPCHTKNRPYAPANPTKNEFQQLRVLLPLPYVLNIKPPNNNGIRMCTTIVTPTTAPIIVLSSFSATHHNNCAKKVAAEAT